MINVKNIVVGEIEANCYLVGDQQSFILIDPGDDFQKITENFKDQISKVKAIICTHAHYDHVGAVADIQKKYNIPVWFHEEEKRVVEAMFTSYGIKRFKVDRWLKDGEMVSGQRSAVSSLNGDTGDALKIMHTPGHSPGGICLYNDEFVITGDTLFADGYLGRIDLAGGSQQEIMKSLEKLLKLPDKLKVYPGHGPATTIAAEKKLHHKIGQRI